MRTITSSQWLKILDRSCNKGKHKLRTNKFGITFCVNCGLLSTAVNAGDPLSEDDKLNIIKDE